MSNKDVNININAKNNVSSTIDDILKSLRLLTEQTHILQTSSNPLEMKNIVSQLTQELSQLQHELLAIKKTGDAEMVKEIAKSKQDEIDLEEKSALELVKVAETEAQQQLELGQLSNSKFLEKQRTFEAQRYQIALKASQDRRALLADGDTGR